MHIKDDQMIVLWWCRNVVGFGCTSETRLHKSIFPHLQCLIHLVVFIHIINVLFVSMFVEYVLIFFLQLHLHNSLMSWMHVSGNNRCFECCIPPPPYRMQEGCEESFHKHLNILRVFYYEVKWAKARDGTKHFNPLLDHWELNLQQWMLKMAMKRSHKATMLPPFDVSPLTQLWMTMNGRCLLK